MNFAKHFFMAAVVAVFGVSRTHAAWSYSSPTAQGACGNLDSTGSASDFSITAVVSASSGGATQTQTLKVAFVMPTDTSTHPDIIFIERTGAIKYYTALTGAVMTMGTVTNVSTATEDGLIGVAVESPFKNRVYVVYAHTVTSNAANTIISGSFRLSRFDMDATTKLLNMSGEKVLLDVPSARNRWHTAGGLRFDKAGNLFWAIGDNETTVTGPGNAHDLRGKILRIHPNDDGLGYTIPTGNYAEVWANTFQGQGRTALATLYRDSTKVKPEIYVQGVRNAYVLNVNPYNDQLTYSQCGPDYGGTTELWNNTRTPIFAGWAWWAGGTTVTSSQVGSGQYGKNGSSEPTGTTWATYQPASKAAPINKWTANMAGAPTMGVDTLPPMSDAKYYLDHGTANCAMGSLIVNYDGRIKNPAKLPPQMNNVWITGNYGTHYTYAAKVDSNGNPSVFGTGAGAWARIWNSFIVGTSAATFQAMTDFQQGPDGAFYVVNYMCGSGTGANAGPGACGGIARIEYKGTACSDTALHPGGSTTPTAIAQQIFRSDVDWLHLGSNVFSVYTEGKHEIRIMDSQGRVVVSIKGEGRKDYEIPSTLPSNAVYYLEVKTNRGTNVRGFLHL